MICTAIDTSDAAGLAALEAYTSSLDDMCDDEGVTVAHRAAAVDNVKCLEYLWRANSSIMLAADHVNNTPAHFAAAAGAERCLIRLHAWRPGLAGAFCLNGLEQAPIHRAIAAGHEYTVRLLYGLGTNKSETDESDYSGLYGYAIYAARRPDARMLEVLCDLGAPMNRTRVNDELIAPGISQKKVDTPARVALDSGNIDGLSFLLGPEYRGIWIRDDKQREIDYDVDLAKTIYSLLPCKMEQVRVDSNSVSGGGSSSVMRLSLIAVAAVVTVTVVVKAV